MKQDSNNNSHRNSTTSNIEDKSNSTSFFKMFTYLFIITLCFCGLAFLYFFIKLNSNKSIILLENKDMIKPIIDTKQYRVIKLYNNLEVTLISDQESEVCGASMGIGLGYLNEDNDIEGFTHLLEHVVFSGSKKFSSHEFFESQLSMFYGETESFTEEEKMSFSFQVDWKGFENSLEIFSWMFKDPLIEDNNNDLQNSDSISNNISGNGNDNEDEDNTDNYRKSNSSVKKLNNKIKDVKLNKKADSIGNDSTKINKNKNYKRKGKINNEKKNINVNNADTKIPLLKNKSKSIISKSIDIINQEFELSKQSNSWKENQILKTLANQDHPYSKQSIGNLDSLTSVSEYELRKKLRVIFNKYFTPMNMKLVLYSNQDLNSLQIFAEKYFKTVGYEKVNDNINNSSRNNILSNSNIPTNPNESRYTIIQEKLTSEVFGRQQISKLVWYEKLDHTNTLDIVFPLKEQLSNIYTKPHNYLSYFLKYSGENSLIQNLIKRNLAVKLESGLIGSYRTFALFGISVTITKEGLSNINDVVSIVFQYINLIVKEQPNEDIYSDIQKINEAKFFFNDDFKNTSEGNDKDNSNSSTDISVGSTIIKAINKVSLRMFDYNYKEILISDYLHYLYNEKTILEFMGEIKINNSLVIIGSSVIPDYFLKKNESNIDIDLNNLNNNGVNDTSKNSKSNDNSNNPANSRITSNKINSLNLKLSKQNNNIELDSNYQLTIEPTYKTPYIKTDIPETWIQKLSTIIESSSIAIESNLKLRGRNNHITKQNNIISCFGEGEVVDSTNKEKYSQCKKELLTIKPKQLLKKSSIEFYSKLDRTFYAPKANTYINLIPLNIREEHSQAFVYLFSNYLSLTISSKLADIVDSGNNIEIDFNENGIDLFMSTYSDLVYQTLDKVFESIFDDNITASQFDEILEYCKMLISNESSKIPFLLSEDYLDRIVKVNVYDRKKIADDFELVNYSDFLTMMKLIQNKLFIKVMVYGVYDEEEINKLEFKLNKYISGIDLNKDVKYITDKLNSHNKDNKDNNDRNDFNNNDESGLSIDKDLNSPDNTSEQRSSTENNEVISSERRIKRKLSINLEKTKRRIKSESNSNTKMQISSNQENKINTNINASDKSFPKELLQKYPFATAIKAHKLLIGEYIYKVQKKQNDDNMLSLYYQIGERTPKNYVLSELLELAWGNIFYYNLKTLKNLGYYVSALSKELDNVMYIEIIIQSKESLTTLSNEISLVLNKLKKRIEFMDNEKISSIKNSFNVLLDNKEMSLKERSDRAWNEIYDGIYDFDFKTKSRIIFEKITKQDLIDFYNNVFIRNINRVSILYTELSELPKNKNDSFNNIDKDKDKDQNTSLLFGIEIKESNIDKFSLAYVDKTTYSMVNDDEEIINDEAEDSEVSEDIENEVILENGSQKTRVHSAERKNFLISKEKQ